MAGFTRRAGCVVAATLVALGLGVGPARAGDPRPPRTNGYVAFSEVGVVAQCGHADRLLGVDVTLHYDATTSKVDHSYLIGGQEDGDGAIPIGTVPTMHIAAGHHGSKTRTIDLRAAHVSTDHLAMSVFVSDSGFAYMNAMLTFKPSCTHPKFTPRAPVVAVTPVSCRGRYSVTFDARHADGTWRYDRFDQPGRATEHALPSGVRTVLKYSVTSSSAPWRVFAIQGDLGPVRGFEPLHRIERWDAAAVRQKRPAHC